MNHLDRRQWLKSMGLLGSLAFINQIDALAEEIPTRPLKVKEALRLNANENPYGPSKTVRQAMIDNFDEACRYPFRVLSGLTKAIADKEGVTEDHVVVTGGSTEGLNATGLVYGLNGGEIIAADPTFQALLRYAENFGAYVHRVPVNDKLEHDLDEMAKRITSKTRLIFICNPNNPTGTLINKSVLKDFITSVDNEAVVFSDEAYYDFITEPDYPSMVELVKENRNVIVSKTFSKIYGLAGLRVGYLIARPDIAERLRNSVMANTNILAITAAKAALEDDTFYQFSLGKNIEAKDYLYQQFDAMKLGYMPSHTNFVFFKSGWPIRKLIDAMKDQGVLIGRPFPPMENWARISTGTMEEMKLFTTALKKVMT